MNKKVLIVILVLAVVAVLGGAAVLFGPRFLAPKEAPADQDDAAAKKPLKLYALTLPEPSKRYIKAAQASGPFDVAVLPLIIRYDKGYSFDLCLRRGFDRIATVLAEAFSTANMPLPGAVDEVKALYYPVVFNKPLPLLGEDPKAQQALDQSCQALNTRSLFFGELTLTSAKSALVLREYDCGARQAAEWTKTLSEDGMSPDIMEQLSLDGALVVSREISSRFPGGFSLAKLKASQRGTDEQALKDGKRLLEQNNAFSLIEAVDRFSAAAASNPYDSRAWAGLSEAWASLGFEIRDVFSVAERFWLPAYTASRIARLLDPGDPDVNLTAAWADFQTKRDAGAERELESALKRDRRDTHARAIQCWWKADKDTMADLVADSPNDLFLLKLEPLTSNERGRWTKYDQLIAKAPDSTIWLNTRIEDQFRDQSSFVEGMYFFLSAADLAAGAGSASISEMNAAWDRGEAPIVPDPEGESRKQTRLVPAAPANQAEVEAVVGRDQFYDAAAGYFAQRDKWLDHALSEPGRWRERPLASVNAGPATLHDYLAGICYLDVNGHINMLTSISWPEPWRAAVMQLQQLFPDLPEPHAKAVTFCLAVKEIPLANKILEFSFRRFEDSMVIFWAYQKFGKTEMDTHVAYTYDRVTMRWPYDYWYNEMIAKFYLSLKTTEHMPMADSFDAALAARPNSTHAMELKAKYLRKLGRHDDADKLEAQVEKIKNRREKTNSKSKSQTKSTAKNKTKPGAKPKGKTSGPKVPQTVAERKEQIEDAIDKDPRRYESCRELRDLLVQNNDAEAAIEAMKSCHEKLVSPLDKAWTVNAIGIILLNEGRVNEAMKYLTSPENARTGSIFSLTSIGKGYFALGDEKQAEKWFNEALERYKGNSGPYMYWGGMLLDRGRLDEAEAKLVKAFEMEKSLDTYHLLLALRVRQDRLKANDPVAPGKLEEKWKQDFLFNLGAINLHGRKDFAAAEQIIAALRSFETCNSRDDILAADMAMLKEDWTGLADQVSIIHGNSFNTDPKVTDYLEIYGLLRQNKKKDAAERAKNSYKMDYPAHVDQMIAARVALENKKVPQAAKHLALIRDSAELPSDVPLEFLMGELFLEVMEQTKSKKDQEIAMTFSQRMKRKNDHPWLWNYYIGRSYEIMGQSDQAAKAYEETLKWAPGFTAAKERLEAL